MAKRKTAFTYEDIYRLREASQPSLAPDGTVAFVVSACDEDTDSTTTQIWSVRSGEQARKLTNGPADSAPAWSPDGSQLAFIRKVDSKPQIHVLPANGGEARTLTDLSMGATGFVWSPDASRLAVLGPVDLDGDPEDDAERQRRANAPRVITSSLYKSDGTGLLGSRRVHLFVVDVETGQAEPLTKGDVNVSGPAWSPDGKRIAFAASTDDRETTFATHVMIVDATGGAPEDLLKGLGWEGTGVAPFWSPDGKTLGFVGAREPGPGHSRLFARTFGRTKTGIDELASDFDRNVMVGGPAYPGALPRFVDDDTIVFCARDRGCTNVFRLHDGEVTRIVGDESSVVSGLARSGGRIAYVLSTPDIPADVFVANVDGTDAERLTFLNDDLLAERKVHRCEQRTFTAPDGREIHGFLMRGDGPKTKPQPLLVDIHGGPHNAWSPVFDTAHLYQEVLAAQGWSTLRLNPRGSDGYGEDFFTAVIGGWGIYDEHDFLSAVDALVDEGVADPDRLAVCGYSYGGFMTNWLTARTDRFRAAMSGGTVSDLQSIYGTSDFGAWMGRFEHGGELHDAREAFTVSSPLSYVRGVTAPTLILHGESDDRCPIGQAEQWFASLKAIGCTTELVRYPGASHLFIVLGRPSHRVDYNRRIAEWMTTHTPSR